MGTYKYCDVLYACWATLVSSMFENGRILRLLSLTKTEILFLEAILLKTRIYMIWLLKLCLGITLRLSKIQVQPLEVV